MNEWFYFTKRREFRKICEIAALYVILLITLLNITSTADAEVPSDKTRRFAFKDFIEKYSPATVWDQIDKEKADGANYTLIEETDRFFEGIDPTDELLKLKVKNGNAKILTQKSGRRWNPAAYNGTFSNITVDSWSNRYRIVELMKQAIYQARNKMVIMQMLRDDYRNQSSYKIAYIIAKTDFATKVLSDFATRAYRACSMKRQKRKEPEKLVYTFLEIVYTIEKLMHLWFEVDLLIELFWTNHLIAQRATNKRKIINVKRWNEKFVN